MNQWSMRRRAFALVAVALLSGCGLISGSAEDVTPADPVVPVDGEIVVDLEVPLAEISPLIRGVSGDARDFVDANVTLNSWGGQRATRYNYQLGNAWNTGRGGAFRNESAPSADDLVGDWLASNTAAGIESRVAVPALGWIARNGDPATCSFPDDFGEGCLQVSGSDCSTGGPLADPRRANVGSSPATVGEWIGGYDSARRAPAFLAVDNEPERWGIDHYDVHPTCSGYFEIFGTYVAYASALRDASSSAQLAGPVMCCWYEFADPPGPGDGTDVDLLTWFLEMLSDRAADGGFGTDPLLDVVDLHYRPSVDVVNGQSGTEIDEVRTEATRELWDPAYRAAESGEIIRFLPRVRETIDTYFPDMPLMVSDWRFGGEDSIGGAVAIFETLGIFAREGVFARCACRHLDARHPWLPSVSPLRQLRRAGSGLRGHCGRREHRHRSRRHR